MMIEIPLGDSLSAIRRGDTPPNERVFPSREATVAYHIVRAWAIGQGLTGRRELCEALHRRWPFLPWGEMQRWALIKNAAKLLREDRC
jgi:hypothetical protein